MSIPDIHMQRRRVKRKPLPSPRVVSRYLVDVQTTLVKSSCLIHSRSSITKTGTGPTLVYVLPSGSCSAPVSARPGPPPSPSLAGLPLIG